jgi:hypothetical protein
LFFGQDSKVIKPQTLKWHKDIGKTGSNDTYERACLPLALASQLENRFPNLAQKQQFQIQDFDRRSSVVAQLRPPT